MACFFQAIHDGKAKALSIDSLAKDGSDAGGITLAEEIEDPMCVVCHIKADYNPGKLLRIVRWVETDVG